MMTPKEWDRLQHEHRKAQRGYQRDVLLANLALLVAVLLITGAIIWLLVWIWIR